MSASPRRASPSSRWTRSSWSSIAKGRGVWERLGSTPGGKRGVTGAVPTRGRARKSRDEQKRKTDAASRYVPAENLSLSPQCGFASHKAGSGLTFEQQEAKMRLVVET